MTFTISPAIKQCWPETALGLLLYQVQVAPSSPQLLAQFDQTVASLAQQYTLDTIAKHPHIAATRQAYKALGASPHEHRNAAEAMLRDLGLGDSLRQPVRTLSGGMKRRVAILRALCAPYDVLFCDEPFKGLDEGTKGRAMEYFQKHTQGRTVILVTHEKNEANFLKGQLLLL